jgi:phosphoribosylformylglycinamidine synthase
MREPQSGERVEARRDVRVLVITGLGLNCEAETAAGFRLAGASPELVHLLDLLERPAGSRLQGYGIVAFIGGFSFGDHLGAGTVFANKLRWRLQDELLAFVARGGLALGICNGFQTLVRLGLLPGLDAATVPQAALAPNDRAGYRDAWVTIGFEPSSRCVWTRGLSRLELPARHGEGKFIAPAPTIERLGAQGQIVARYLAPDGQPTMAWPYNPNGSAGAIAAVCDPSGRVMALMPHPDAYLRGVHHPRWRAHQRAGSLRDVGDGVAIFRRGVDAAAGLD